eukprot:883571_1
MSQLCKVKCPCDASVPHVLNVLENVDDFEFTEQDITYDDEREMYWMEGEGGLHFCCNEEMSEHEYQSVCEEAEKTKHKLTSKKNRKMKMIGKNKKSGKKL